MTLDEFRLSFTAEQPAGLSLALAGLWWDAKGDWKRAHESAQEDAGREGAWVHAYLHRKEGDSSNAGWKTKSLGPGAANPGWQAGSVRNLEGYQHQIFPGPRGGGS